MTAVESGASRRLVEAYLTARETVVAEGFAWEIDWQETRRLSTLTESDFIRQAAWVILCAGMREMVVRGRFAGISAAFLNWRSADGIRRRRHHCEREALKVFNNPRKIRAIADTCDQIATVGFSKYMLALRDQGVSKLEELPQIGAVTKYHLAKNIGLPVVKPDRHLVRVSAATSFGTPLELCTAISDVTGDCVTVVDVVIWRFATLRDNYAEHFAAATSGNRQPEAEVWGRANSPADVETKTGRVT